MLPLMIAFAGLVFTAVRRRDLPVGRALHEVLIAAPAAWLLRTPPRRIVIILLLLIGAALVWVEIGPMLMSLDYAPVLWFADITLYVDALMMIGVAVAAVRLKSVAGWAARGLRRALAARRTRPRARASSPRRRKPPPSANDDAPGSAIPLAA
ncbi:hypothetical protein [Phenylobacterium sp.]|uniref:hypothetical protein n=1 Tax=Phenylobacterium sp. TaxID=1871053 RepID=UPI0011FBF20D|nr:hypothetical protein [Phenylobacterium sp.]THD64067.1 MAG: hypothetical protein E8A49_03465 [Phenylobacterium sp.]